MSIIKILTFSRRIRISRMLTYLSEAKGKVKKIVEFSTEPIFSPTLKNTLDSLFFRECHRQKTLPPLAPVCGVMDVMTWSTSVMLTL